MAAFDDDEAKKSSLETRQGNNSVLTHLEWAEFRNQLTALSQVLEKMRLAEYIAYLNRPGRLLLINFSVSLVRGLGAALGASILAGLALLLLKRVVVFNLPLIGGLLAELIKIVNSHIGS